MVMNISIDFMQIKKNWLASVTMKIKCETIGWVVKQVGVGNIYTVEAIRIESWTMRENY